MVKTYDSVILEIYEHINNFADFFAGKTPYKDDLIQETILVVLEMDRDRIMLRDDIKNLKGFVYFIMFNSINSSTSPFYKKIKKFNHSIKHINLDGTQLDSDGNTYFEMHLKKYNDEMEHLSPTSKGYRDYETLEKYHEICKFLSEKGTAEELSLFKCLVSEGTAVAVHKEVVEVNPDVSYHTINKRIRKMKKKIQDANL